MLAQSGLPDFRLWSGRSASRDTKPACLPTSRRHWGATQTLDLNHSEEVGSAESSGAHLLMSCSNRVDKPNSIANMLD